MRQRAQHPDPLDRVQFLMRPAVPGKIQLVISRGEGVKLTPAIEAALEGLARELQNLEIQGLLNQACEPVVTCDPIKCENVFICSLSDPQPCSAIS